MKNRKVQMWAIAISSYNCTIEYIRGKDNKRADMLSRLSHDVEAVENKPPLEVGVINSDRVTAVNDSDRDNVGKADYAVDKLDLPDMAQEQMRDLELRKIKKNLDNPMTKESVKRKCTVVDGLLYYLGHGEEDEPGMRLLVPNKYRQEVLKQYHDGCAHWGIDKTFGLIRRNYHWVGLYRDVVNYVTQCITCRIRSQKQNKSPLQEMEEVTYAFQKIHLDLCGP